MTEIKSETPPISNPSSGSGRNAGHRSILNPSSGSGGQYNTDETEPVYIFPYPKEQQRQRIPDEKQNKKKKYDQNLNSSMLESDHSLAMDIARFYARYNSNPFSPYQSRFSKVFKKTATQQQKGLYSFQIVDTALRAIAQSDFKNKADPFRTLIDFLKICSRDVKDEIQDYLTTHWHNSRIDYVSTRINFDRLSTTEVTGVDFMSRLLMGLQYYYKFNVVALVQFVLELLFSIFAIIISFYYIALGKKSRKEIRNIGVERYVQIFLWCMTLLNLLVFLQCSVSSKPAVLTHTSNTLKWMVFLQILIRITNIVLFVQIDYKKEDTDEKHFTQNIAYIVLALHGFFTLVCVSAMVYGMQKFETD
jgi:hypothetical protein